MSDNNSSKRITYIVSNIDKAVAFEWIATHLDKKRFQLSFILLNQHDSFLERFLTENNIQNIRISLDSKKSYPKAILQTRTALKNFKTEVVHCHMREANIIGLTAAKSLGIKQRIYTRHYSTYNHQFHPKAVKMDKMIHKMATDIVAISQVVQSTLMEKEQVNPAKVTLIHHGFDLDRFRNPIMENVLKLKQKYSITNAQPVIGVIARYMEWKGHQYIIEAAKKIVNKYPHSLFIFANAKGPEESRIKKLIQQRIPNNTLEIPFENDLYSLYHLLDMYIHTPIDPSIEAFGQTYVEALAAGTPSIFTLSGVAHEFIVDNKNALVIDYKNSDEIYQAVDRMLTDKSLAESIVEEGYLSVQNFNLNLFISKLEKLYG